MHGTLMPRGGSRFCAALGMTDPWRRLHAAASFGMGMLATREGGSKSAASVNGTNVGMRMHAANDPRNDLVDPPSKYGSRVQTPSWMRSSCHSLRKERPRRATEP